MRQIDGKYCQYNLHEPKNQQREQGGKAFNRPMPFVYRQTGRKTRRTNKAYSDYRAFEMSLHNAVHSIALPSTENTTTDPENMGRKS
ncbi:Hypothetical predicted protein [Pelobates cultripes]|uniref:Uncharacterized protein n=1 Tax=Pelobates cultripes TaxID=61616 RepID=A0AAD1RG79_PELCU|nr:Hypothetical predicted protein [Pelobates cultripes]